MSNTTDTRAKLETLFRRIVDPAVSDLDALSDFVWFRKLALGAKDVQEVLGPAASTPAPAPAAGADDGPMWPFKKKHAGESIAHIARTDPEYLRYFLGQTGDKALREPLLGHVRKALGVPAPQASKPPAAPAKPSDDFENP